MELRDLAVAIVTSEEARERDRLAIEAGTPSIELMRNAGATAARRIEHHFRNILAGGVEIYVGSGNNGGDGRIVAAELAGRGAPVFVVDAKSGTSESPTNAAIVVDALLGTGSRGAPTGYIRKAANRINLLRREGAKVVALDLPTGLDASTGEAHDPVLADLTLSFGTAKRAHVLARQICGALEILDIGLGQFGRASDSGVALASRDWVREHIPTIPADAHKGTRKRLAIIAGDVGMAGAAILAGKGALRSGIGLLHLVVARESRDAVHAAVPAALVSTHDELVSDAPLVLAGANALVVGPGLRPETARSILKALDALELPVVLDAGALTAMSESRADLPEFSVRRQVVLTPHPAEMGRLLGISTEQVLRQRFEIGGELAAEINATVLLKGTPTIVSHLNHGSIATATGNSSLATGGSGDLLSGMIGTLLAQMRSGFESAVCAAWVHGRAAELCGAGRGVTLDDVLFAMPAAWKLGPETRGPGVLASLPSVQ